MLAPCTTKAKARRCWQAAGLTLWFLAAPAARAATGSPSVPHPSAQLPTPTEVSASERQAVLEPAAPALHAPYIDWTARELVAFGVGRAPQAVPLLAEAFPLAEAAAIRAAKEALVALLADSNVLPHALAAHLATSLAPPAGATRPTAGTAHELRPPAPRPLDDQQQAMAALVETALGQAAATRTSYVSDGRVEVELAWPLDGGRAGLGEVWLAMRDSQRRAGSGGRRVAFGPAQAERASKNEVRAPTGIVVQARGLGCTPTLWPSIWRAAWPGTAKALLYSADSLAPEMLRASGVAPFVRSLEQALRHPRVAERAMLVRAQARVEGGRASVAINDADADAVAALPELLREGRVIFLID